MNLQIVTGRAGRVFHVDLKQPRTVLIAAAGVLLVIGAVFTAGVELGRIVAGREVDQPSREAADYAGSSPILANFPTPLYTSD